MSLHESTVEALTVWQAPDPAQDTLRHAVLAFALEFAAALEPPEPA